MSDTMAEWQDIMTLTRSLGVSERTVHRWIRASKVETMLVGGRKLYRPVVVRRSEPADVADRPTSGAASDHSDKVMALVQRYEQRVDTLLAERHALAVELERQRAAAQLADVERTRALAEVAALRAELADKSRPWWRRLR